MGDVKLKVDDKNASDPPPDSNKPNSTTDVEDTEKAGKSQEKMTKSNSSEKDGADEEMLSKEKKPTEESKIAMADSEYSLNADKTNGEAKLDIGDLKPAFVGMGKEELMKFANDPFWIRLRWILFISFWLIWLGMLVGAIVIIVTAPKCHPPAPRTWYESGPLAKVIFSDYESIDMLKSKNVKGLIVSHPDEDGYKAVNKSTDILKFLESAKNKEMKVIISLNPVHSDEFFHNSERRSEGLDNYYIWADAKGKMDNNAIPPNNWLAPNNQPAWKYSNTRQQFYYSPAKKPTLNFRNQDVVDKFTEIIKDWVAAGVDGFHLIGIPYMLVDQEMKNESMASNKPGTTHDQYEFYNHVHTVNVEGIAEILKQWRSEAKKIDSGVFMLDEDLLSLDPYKINETLLIDLPKHSLVFEQEGRVTTAEQIYNGISSAQTVFEDWLAKWPIWQYTETTLSPSVMNILTMLLPGSFYISENMEIDSELFKIRGDPSITFGVFHHQVLNDTHGNATVYAYQRVQTGSPGYIVACNPSEKRVVVDLTQMKSLSDEVTIQLLSNNYTVEEYHQSNGGSLKIPAKDFKMLPKSAAVLTYVPK